MKRFASLLALLLALAMSAPAAESPAKPPALPTKHTARNIEGWPVRVDDRLIAGTNAAIGERALKLLTARLVAITIVVPEPALSKLRAVTIELDLDYGELKAMQYHPDAGWLKEHGYSTALAKCAHIPRADDFLSPYENHRMPWVVLHELAHAYHDQVLGFDEPDILSAYKHAVEAKSYDAVERWNGVAGRSNTIERAYAMTNHKEYFAEDTEAFFGRNDFYPFTREELRKHDPGMFKVLERVWNQKRVEAGRAPSR